MNIIVINGSPTGTKGITAQYTAYLERTFPQHNFQVFEVARRIRRIERDEAEFHTIAEHMAAADAIIWCYPVYLMLVPAQLKRFVELLLERTEPSVLAGKVATVISSSAHFYDHTAHDYMRGVSADLGLSFVQGFSAGMEDLLSEEGRHNLLGFAKNFFRHAGGELPVEAAVPPVRWTAPVYDPELPPASPEIPTNHHKRIVVVTDAGSGPEDHNLQRMIDVFERSVSYPVDRLDLQTLRMDGGCLACMGCADTGICGYKDDYAAAFDELVKPADVMIYAGTVRDRFFSARFKTFIDRYFRNGHRPAASQRQLLGYIVSGPLAQLPTMNAVLEATVQVAHGQRLGTVTDEDPDSSVTTAHLQSMGSTVDAWLAQPWFLPTTFLGVAGMKIFRDMIYDNKGVLSADHRYYRANGFYDFPQNNLRKRLVMTLMMLCRRIPFVAKRLDKTIRSGYGRRQRTLVAAVQPTET